MEREKIVTTRELLRDFKVIKELLISRKIDSIVLPTENGQELEIKVKIRPKTGADAVEGLKNLPKVKIKRDPHLFDSFFRYSDRIPPRH